MCLSQIKRGNLVDSRSLAWQQWKHVFLSASERHTPAPKIVKLMYDMTFLHIHSTQSENQDDWDIYISKWNEVKRLITSLKQKTLQSGSCNLRRACGKH